MLYENAKLFSRMLKYSSQEGIFVQASSVGNQNRCSLKTSWFLDGFLFFWQSLFCAEIQQTCNYDAKGKFCWWKVNHLPSGES